MQQRQLVTYLACSLSAGVFGAFNNYTLTLWLTGFTSSYIVLGFMGNTRSFEGSIVAPVVGGWSDRTWLGWFGRRRPFILCGGLLTSLLLAITPAVAAWRPPAALALLQIGKPGLLPAVLAIFLFTLTFNAMGDVHDALMVDITTPGQRNRLAAVRIVVSTAGQVAILVLGFVLWHDSVPASAFVVVAAVVAIGTIVTVLGVREPEPAGWQEATSAAETVAQPRSSLRSFLRRNRGAAVFCLVVFAYWSGVNAVLPLISVYTRDILHTSTGEAQLLPAVLLLTTTAFALPMAKLGDRFGKRPVIAAGYALVAVAGLLGLVITNDVQGGLVFALAGIGNAASQVLILPLLADLVPRREIGLATGVLAASGSLAAPLASLASGGLANLFGPRIIFGVMAVMITIAIVILRWVPAAPIALEAAAPAVPASEPIPA